MYAEKNILHMKLLHMKLSTNERNLYHDNNRLKRPELKEIPMCSEMIVGLSSHTQPGGLSTTP